MQHPALRLVLGSSGFLGAHALATLCARFEGSEVVGVARRPEEGPSFCVPRDAARLAACDLLEEGQPESLLDELSPAVVLLSAALSRASDCAREPALAQALNVELPRRVATWCAREGARLVHVSSDQVFAGDAPGGGYRESDPPAPLSAYGASKAAGEEAVLEAHPEALVVRLPLLYGNSAGRGLGASDSLLEAVDRGQRPPLFSDEWRSPLEVRNAAEALAELCALDLRGLLHVAGPERVTRHALGCAVLEGMGLCADRARECVQEARRADLGLEAERPRDVALCIERAAALLSTPLAGIEEGVRRALR